MSRVQLSAAVLDCLFGEGLGGSVCLACGDHDPHDTSVEPDARGYTCHACHANQRCGVEEAILCELVEVVS